MPTNYVIAPQRRTPRARRPRKSPSDIRRTVGPRMVPIARDGRSIRETGHAEIADSAEAPVRWGHVALARQRLAGGAYDEPAVMDRAVERLLDDLA